MSFLDRFKPQPRWKHADPAVRAAAVAEMPDDPEHQQALVELAGSDEDVRVRRAALERLNSVEELARFARSDGDETLRRELSERLVGVAVSPNAPAEDAGRALGGLEDQRQLATVAKIVASRWLCAPRRWSAVHDVEGAQAASRDMRRTRRPRWTPSARVTDPAELLNIALKTDHKDAGIAALERAATAAAQSGAPRARSKRVATRAKNKSVAKRARRWCRRWTMPKRHSERRSNSGSSGSPRSSRVSRRWRRRRSPAIQERSSPTPRRTGVQLASAGTFALDPDTTARFGALAAEATRRARSACDAPREAEAPRNERAGIASRKRAVRICERVEAVRGEDGARRSTRRAPNGKACPGPAGPDDADARSARALRGVVPAGDRAARRTAKRSKLRHARLGELSH